MSVKGLALLLAPKGKKEPMGDGHEPMHDDMHGGEEHDDKARVMAAQDILDAIKADDAQALSAALRDHQDLCDYDEPAAEGEEHDGME